MARPFLYPIPDVTAKVDHRRMPNTASASERVVRSHLHQESAAIPGHPIEEVFREAPRYRVLLLDIGGRVIRVRPILAGDDETASDLARTMLDGRAIELWDRTRFIERFGPAQA